jgi:hypothetical protein
MLNESIISYQVAHGSSLSLNIEALPDWVIKEGSS